MKKQLLTSALALSMLLSTTGMAFAASTPANEPSSEMGMKSVNIVHTALSDDLASFTATKVDDANNLAADLKDAFKLSDKKAYTAETYAAEIEAVKTQFDAAVKAGTVTRAAADQVIAQMEKDLQQIKAGTLTLYYAEMLDKDGKVVGKVSVMDATQVTDDQNAPLDIQFSTANK